MSCSSIGTPAVSPSNHHRAIERKSAFTLIESLVALAIILAFAMAFEPLLFQARHILFRGNGQVRAQMLLRSLLEAPFDRSEPEIGVREDESDDMHWRVAVEPFVPEDAEEDPAPSLSSLGHKPKWALYRVTAAVFWGNKQSVTGETLRLGAANDGSNP